MSQNNSGASLPRIRKLLQKNYVDIKYILKPSPLTYNNSVAGKNLIKRSDSYKKIEPKRKEKLVSINSSRVSSEIKNIFIHLNIKEANNDKYHHAVVSSQLKMHEKRKNSPERQSITELKNINSPNQQRKSNKIIQMFLGNKEECQNLPKNHKGLTGSKYSNFNSSRSLIKQKLKIHKSIDFNDIHLGKESIHKYKIS